MGFSFFLFFLFFSPFFLLYFFFLFIFLITFFLLLVMLTSVKSIFKCFMVARCNKTICHTHNDSSISMVPFLFVREPLVHYFYVGKRNVILIKQLLLWILTLININIWGIQY